MKFSLFGRNNANLKTVRENLLRHMNVEKNSTDICMLC